VKSASTAARTEEILYDIVGGSRSKPIGYLEYLEDDGATWTPLGDITDFSLENSNQDYRYGRFDLVPPAHSLSAGIDNARGKYSPSTGGEFDGVLVRNRRVRAYVGYAMSDKVTQTYNFAVTNFAKHYHTQIISSKVYNNINRVSSTAITAINIADQTWFTYYGAASYGQRTYSVEAAYFSNPIDLDAISDSATMKSLKVTGDGTKIKIFYAVSNDQAALLNGLVGYNYLGNTVNGVATFSLDDVRERYFKFVAVWDTGVWDSTANYITTVQILYEETAEVFQQGDYLMDDPTFALSYGNYTAGFSARDYFKKAFETKVNCPSYTGATDVAVILRDIADRCGIPHNSGGELIPATGHTVTIADADNFHEERAIDAFNECMQYLFSKDSTYRLELNDGYLELVQVSADNTTADWQIDYRYHIISMTRGYLPDKQAQRFTFTSKPPETATAPTSAEKQLATQVYATPQTATDLTWVNPAYNIRITHTGVGHTFVLNSVDIAGKKINFDSTGTVTVTVYGVEATLTGSVGEAIDIDNADNFEGFTEGESNRLIQSAAEATAIGAAFTEEFASPPFVVTCRIPCNPLLELGDKLLIWEKYTNTNTIYRIDRISIAYSADGASMYQDLTLTDLGQNFGTLAWDGNGVTPGAGDNNYDKGFLWDQDLGTSATSDLNTYNLIRTPLT
jgi:hypothetical protein